MYYTILSCCVIDMNSGFYNSDEDNRTEDSNGSNNFSMAIKMADKANTMSKILTMDST